MRTLAAVTGAALLVLVSGGTASADTVSAAKLRASGAYPVHLEIGQSAKVGYDYHRAIPEITQFCMSFTVSSGDKLTEGEVISVRAPASGRLLFEIKGQGEATPGTCVTTKLQRYADGKQRFLLTIESGSVDLLDGYVETSVR